MSESSNSRSTVDAPIRIRRDALRDHGDAERIDRVWERLEPKLTLGRTPRRASGKWPLVATAVAAGFALGIATSNWLDDERQPRQAVAPDTAGLEQSVEVFAAGTEPRSYALPGGGTLTLEPGSIVDTISRDGRALTLRLVRGDATLASPGDASSVELMVGSAHFAPAAGARMHVRRDGDHAFLEVFEGTADITAPNEDNEMVSSRLGAHSARRLRVRITTASLPVEAHDATPLMRHPHDDPDEEAETPADEPTETPAWVTACKVDNDDERTFKLLQENPDALTQLTDPQVLSCLARGQRASGDADAAVASYEKLMDQSDTLRAYQASKSLQRLVLKLRNQAQSDADRQKYAAKLANYTQRERQLALAAVAKGIDLTPFMGAQGMCRRISAEAGVAKPNWEAVASLAAQYKKAFPTGECIATINGILAKRPAPEDDAEGEDEKATEEDSPYEESGD